MYDLKKLNIHILYSLLEELNDSNALKLIYKYNLPINKINLNWIKVSKDKKLNSLLISIYKDYIKWSIIIKYQKLTITFIKKHRKDTSLEALDLIKSKDMRKQIYLDILERNLLKYQVLTEEYICKNINKEYMAFIIQYQKVSESFIEEYLINKKHRYKDFCLQLSLFHQNLSEEFIIKHYNHFSFHDITKLSYTSINFLNFIIPFIRRNQSMYMRNEFIKNILKYNKNITNEFINNNLDLFTDELLNENI